MEPISSLRPRKTERPKKSQYLHSPSHLLAEELSTKLRDRKHFGFYLKMALLYDHTWLRKLASEVLESATVRSPGKLFSYLIKQRKDKNQ